MGENFGRYEDIEVKITGPDDEEIKKIKRMNGTFDNANLSPILVKTLTVSFIWVLNSVEAETLKIW